jgi:hypothetical protein
MFKLNTERTYKYPVTVVVYDEQGAEQSGTFTATFKTLPHDEKREGRLLDHVLVAVEGIEVGGADGEPLSGAALLDALKKDPAASTAMVAAYNESIVKKNLSKT